MNLELTSEVLQKAYEELSRHRVPGPYQVWTEYGMVRLNEDGSLPDECMTPAAQSKLEVFCCLLLI